MADMVSKTITYGKKRSLLQSMGSRRRQKYISESFPTKKAVALSPAPKRETIRLVQPESLELPRAAIDETCKPPEQKSDQRHANSVDDMASQLLDDTNSTFRTKEPTPRSPDESSSARKSAPSLIDDLLMSPLALSPLHEKTSVSPDARSRTSRIGKHSSMTSRKASRQVAPMRSRSEATQKRKESGLLRPMPQSKSSVPDPLKSHPISNLQATSSNPHHVADGNMMQKSSDATKTTSPGEVPSPDEINQKVRAMLAATNALKPQSAPVGDVPPSKFSRIVPTKMLAKVSNAWDRFQSKSSQAHSSSNKRSKGHPNEELDELMQPDTPAHTPSHHDLSPISTIEIRLNEGDNLNKKKVRKIVGGQVVRKPVADDGKSLRAGKSIEDPFGHPGSTRTPTPFESLLQVEAEGLCGSIPPVPSNPSPQVLSTPSSLVLTNPFESEKEFDNDIEDRILSTTPVGSSTPRARVERGSYPSADQSPTKARSASSKAETDLMLDQVALKLEQGELSTAKPVGFTSLRASQRKIVDPVRRVRQHSINTAQTLDMHGLKRTKKHPSPSKEALEDLEMAFRKYTQLKTSGAKDHELDELATSFMSTPSSLAPRDKNRLISTRPHPPKAGEASLDSQNANSRPYPSPSSTRLPRPIENPIKLRPAIRLAPRFRPQAAHADEKDELL